MIDHGRNAEHVHYVPFYAHFMRLCPWGIEKNQNLLQLVWTISSSSLKHPHPEEQGEDQTRNLLTGGLLTTNSPPSPVLQERGGAEGGPDLLPGGGRGLQRWRSPAQGESEEETGRPGLRRGGDGLGLLTAPPQEAGEAGGEGGGHRREGGGRRRGWQGAGGEGEGREPGPEGGGPPRPQQRGRSTMPPTTASRVTRQISAGGSASSSVTSRWNTRRKPS